MCSADEVGRGEFHLKAAHTGGDIYIRKVERRAVDIGGEMLFHSYGRTSATDVSGEGKQLLHGDEVALLVTAHLGGHLEVNLIATRDDADEVSRLVAMKHQGFEHLLDILAQLCHYVVGTEVALIHLIGDKFVGNFRLVHQAGDVGLLDFIFFFGQWLVVF